MTIPYLMNCPHQGDGWCLECVKRLHDHDAVPFEYVSDVVLEGFLDVLVERGNPLSGDDCEVGVILREEIARRKALQEIGKIGRNRHAYE